MRPINPDALSKWDKLTGNDGQTTNHEVTESYFGGKIAQEFGIKKVSPAVKGLEGKASVYTFAHAGRSTKQPAGVVRKMYDTNGVKVPSPADFSVPSNVTKIDYENTSGKNAGKVFHSIKIKK